MSMCNVQLKHYLCEPKPRLRDTGRKSGKAGDKAGRPSENPGIKRAPTPAAVGGGTLMKIAISPRFLGSCQDALKWHMKEVFRSAK